jgi:VCBS repeat-containing protein
MARTASATRSPARLASPRPPRSRSPSPPANDATTIGGDTSAVGAEDTALTGTLTASDADGLLDGTVFGISAGAAHGTATIDPATGAWSYTPVADWHGADSFTVTVTDDEGNATTQTISLTVNAVVDITNDSVSYRRRQPGHHQPSWPTTASKARPRSAPSAPPATAASPSTPTAP